MNPRDLFSKHIFYPLLIDGNWRPYKSKVKANLRDKLSAQYLPLELQRERQFRRLKRLLIFCAEETPYYKDLFRRISFDPHGLTHPEEITGIPVLTKGIIRENLYSILSRNRRGLGKPSLTSGSTGEPLPFYLDRNFRINYEATLRRSNMTAGWHAGAKVVYMLGNPFNKRIRWPSILSNVRCYEPVCKKDFFKCHKELQRFKPEIIVFLSYIGWKFTNFLEENGLRPNYPTKSIINSGGPLYDFMREKMESLFGVEIFDKYGSTEAGVIAMECRAHRGLHINTDDVYLECLGGDVYNRPGELVVTLLNNFKMPFIRYRIGDMAILSSQACPCGNRQPLVKKVVGRDTDVIVTSSGKICIGFWFYKLFVDIKGVSQFQIIQKELDVFMLRIAKNEHLKPGDIETIKKRFRGIVGHDARLTIEFVDRIYTTGAGKLRYVISEVKNKKEGDKK